ncbi:MAG TPA: lysophospholipid acyltransferase family protein [Verrucomicrobiae bacterium]|nr:lysophospholipid acyltransferase family protein [Verrucomicrobiae bacterium]
METPTPASRKLVFIQALLGIGAYLAIALPFLRRTHGLEKLNPSQRYLFVCNHVSLLDTILLGALFWRSGNYPILVLGDKNVWQASWLKKMLSRNIGFLLERGKLNPGRIGELQKFGGEIKKFNLVVFPEGTRGNGVDVAECQPGIYHIAQTARAPLVPVFIENMQQVSTKNGRLNLLGGLRKVEVHFGEPIAPENYLSLSREEFLEFVRHRIKAAGQSQLVASSNAIKVIRTETSEAN